jgi:hypothetical protein
LLSLPDVPSVPAPAATLALPSRLARPTERLAALLPAAALGVCGGVLARFQPAEASAETAYLTLHAACVLAGAALLAPARHRGALLAPALVATALWALPAGPARGAVVGVLLVAAVAAAAWARTRGRAAREWDGLAWLGGAIALHALLRPADFLPAILSPWAQGPAALVRVFLPPAAAALALALLARRRGEGAALRAAVAAALAAAGFTATAALPLLALAFATEVRELRSHGWRGWAATPRLAPGHAAPASATLGRAILGLSILGLFVLGLSILRPAAGGLALAAGAAVLAPGVRGVAVAALPLVAGLGLAAAGQSGLGPLTELWQLVPLLPLALLPGRMPGRRLLAALLLAAGGLLLLPAPPALAAAAALLGLELRRDDAAAAAERVWLAVLLALAALCAAYPWLRGEPLLAAAHLLGVPAGWTGAAAVLAAALAVLAVAELSARAGGGLAARRGELTATAGAAAVVVVATIAALPPHPRDLLRGAPAELVAETSWSHRWRGTMSWLRIETLLTDAAAVPAGAPAAIVRLESQGHTVDRLLLRAGSDTGEWAADRPDLRGRVAAPPAALSWVSPGGESFAHAYRVVWRRPPGRVQRIVVERAPELPADATLVVRRVEVAR